jgi:hypothetical protein
VTKRLRNKFPIGRCLHAVVGELVERFGDVLLKEYEREFRDTSPL